LNTKLLVLIVSPPGDLQIGLQALLTTHLDVDVLVVGEGSSALKVINHQNPAAVILDHNLPGNAAPKIIRDIKTDWPGITCIVLINDEQGRQSFLEMGADLIAIKGLPGAKLVREIKRLIDLE
jgi:DNA-binding NarL/FixJ family response regulator